MVNAPSVTYLEIMIAMAHARSVWRSTWSAEATAPTDLTYNYNIIKLTSHEIFYYRFYQTIIEGWRRCQGMPPFFQGESTIFVPNYL